MPSPRRFDPRQFFGYTGSPLPVAAESVPMTQQMRDRFKQQGMDSFIPYVNPWETLARTQAYQRAGTLMNVADAENAFVNELQSGHLSGGGGPQTGLQQFLKKNPLAQFSPMVQTYQKAQEKAYKDPYEAAVAKEGAEYLHAYRQAVASGQPPMDAFAEFRTVLNGEKAKQKAASDDELWFVQAGGDLNDLPALQEKGASRAAMLDFIRKKGKPISTTEGKQLTKLQDDLEAAAKGVDDPEVNTEDVRKEAFAKAYPGRQFTGSEKDWQDAYYAAKQAALAGPQGAYDDYVAVLEEQGKRLPVRSVPHGTSPPIATPSPTSAPAPPVQAEETTAQRLLREARERAQKLKQ